jgi:hypothetical protein
MEKRYLIHPSDGEMASFWSGTLSTEAQERMAAHVDECAACEARLERIEPACSRYRKCLNLVHEQTQRSPSPEARLWTRMEEAEVRRAPRPLRVWRPAWVTTGMAAALVSLALLLLSRVGGSELRAESLLRQAANAPSPAGSQRHLRIKTSHAVFERPVMRSAAASREEAAIRARFVAAHYNWDDPLSARSFSDWRHGLKHKTSEVQSLRGASGKPEQSIETRTKEGVLREASLILDDNLSPVSAQFRFADQEWVEVTTLPKPSTDPVETPSMPAAPKAVGRETLPIEPLAVRELRVRLAIDALEVGAEQPIDVSVDAAGAILVTTYHLAPELEAALRANLEEMPSVTLRSATGQQIQQSPTEPMDRAIRASQDVSFEAHLLAGLANRFDASSETQLGRPDKTKLWGMRSRHAIAMNRDLMILWRELQRQRADFRSGSAGSSALSSDGSQAQRLAESAASVDRLVTLLFANPDSEAEKAASWRKLAVELGELQGQSASYARYVERRSKELR